jgi:threonine dehydratase
LSGTAIAAKGLRPGIRVFGAEPANADDASRAFRSGRVEPVPPTATIADGLRSPVSARTLAAIRANVEAIGTASEESIVRAMRLTWEKMKIVIEPSCAVPLACLLERTLDVAGARVGIILSGGNVDLDRLPWQA